MTHVKFFDRTYTLPSLVNDRFSRLQQRVNKQYRRLHTEVHYRPRRFGVIRLSSGPPSPDERFQQLSRLVRNYQQLIDELYRSQASYQRFFAELAAGVQHALGEKREELQTLEQERQRSYQDALALQDDTLVQLAQEDEARLLQGVRLLGQAALLLLKKIAICQGSLSRLATDQERQRQILLELIGHLDRHYQAYDRRKRIDKVVREVAEIAEVAIEFEAYMRQQLMPLQDLLDHVVKIDATLHHAMTEIEELTQCMLQQETLFTPEMVSPHHLTQFDTQLLDFLTSGQLKKERLAELWEQLRHHDKINIDTEISLLPNSPSDHPIPDALDNIERLVDLHLTPLISDEKQVTPHRLPTPWHLLSKPTDIRKVTSTKTLWRTLTTTADQFSSRVLHAAYGLNLELVLIPAGTCQIGSTVFDDEQPLHDVRISQPFYLGKYPVVQAQWEAIMGYQSSSLTGISGARRPVENVSWEDAQLFISKLNTLEGHQKYRLPTEAEWEYAARATSTTAYGFGDTPEQLRKYAWYADNSDRQPHPVGRLKPNAWGLHDMLGNVWEWVQDWYEATGYASHLAQDPQGALTGTYRVTRGGGWDSYAGDCRLASRNVEYPDGRHQSLGFRLLRRL